MVLQRYILVLPLMPFVTVLHPSANADPMSGCWYVQSTGRSRCDDFADVQGDLSLIMFDLVFCLIVFDLP